MSFEHTADARLIAFYQGIREQVAADDALGGGHRLTGEGGGKQYAQSLDAPPRVELQPIIWPR